jgi:RNA polymerase sigma factor (sigma-70 family)
MVLRRPAARSDRELLTGDGEAFAAFYARHEDAILGYFRRRVPSAELAADLAAETFAAALAGRDGFDPDRGEVRGWLFGIARHLLAQSLERGRVDDAARRTLGMQRVVLTDQELARVDALTGTAALDALSALPEELRLAVAGRVVDEREYRELAAALRCSESLARQRVSRGLRTLRTRLEELR